MSKYMRHAHLYSVTNTFDISLISLRFLRPYRYMIVLNQVNHRSFVKSMT